MYVEAKSLGHSSPIVPTEQLPVSGSGKGTQRASLVGFSHGELSLGGLYTSPPF